METIKIDIKFETIKIDLRFETIKTERRFEAINIVGGGRNVKDKQGRWKQ